MVVEGTVFLAVPVKSVPPFPHAECMCYTSYVVFHPAKPRFLLQPANLIRYVPQALRPNMDSVPDMREMSYAYVYINMYVHMYVHIYILKYLKYSKYSKY